MKTFIINVSGQTEVDIYNAIAYVKNLVHKQQLFGEGTLIRGFLEGAGKYNFKSYGEYETVLPKEVDQLLKDAEALLSKSNIYIENTHRFELRELSQEEKNDFEQKNPETIPSKKNTINRIVFDITVSGESQYAVEEFIQWVYDKVSQGTLSHKLAHIKMLPNNISGYCSIESYGKHQGAFESSVPTGDDDEESNYSGSNNESRNTYCSACQQDPCECRDKEKTSIVYDF